MKQKILTSIATGIIIASGVITPLFGLLLNTFNPSVAYAQNQLGGGATTFDGETPSTSTTITTSVGETTTTYTAPETGSVPPPDNIGGAESGLNCGVNVLCALVQFVGTIFTFASNLVATVSGLIADFALWFSIQSNSYGIINPFLENGWKLIRDFTNLVFIFALLVVGFVLIFDTKTDSASSVRLDPKRTIAYVIIMALLVNFSFFITRSVIEVGNVSAAILYSSITGDSGGQADQSVADQNTQITDIGSPSTWFTSNTFVGMKSLSLGILNKINPQQFILDDSTIKNAATSGTGGVVTYEWGFYILYIFLAIATAVFNLMLTYIFISMAILFIGRYIGLAFLIIFSPLAFVSKTIPALENKEYIGFTDWFSELVGLTFVAPIYLLFVYLTIMFLNTDLFGADLTGYILVATVVSIKLIIVSFVLLRGKSLAVSMSGHIGKMAGGLIDKAAILGVGMATAGTGMLAAQTFGRAGGALAKSGTLQRLTQSKPDMDIDSVERRGRLAGGIRKLGVGRYNPLRSSMNKLAGSVERGDLSVGAMKAKAATGVRGMSKSFATINPYDIGIAGMTGRKGLSALANNTKNEGLAQGLANDFVNNPVTGIKKTTALNRMFDIEASKNAKKTLTNTIAGAMTSGLNSGNQGGGGSTTSNTTSGPVTVTGPNTGPVPNPQGWSGAKGPVPGVKLPNDFSGMKLATPTPTPGGANAAQKEESEKLTELYDREKEKQSESVDVENLTVKNLKVESGLNTGEISLPSRTSNAGLSPQKQATTLLSGIQMTPRATNSASNYTSAAFGPTATDRAREAVNNAGDINFEQKYQNVKPAIDAYEKAGGYVNTVLKQAADQATQNKNSSLLVDPSGNPVSSKPTTTSPTKTSSTLSQADRDARTKRIQDSMEKTIMNAPTNEVWGNDDAGNPITDYDDWKHFQLTGENKSLPK